MPISVAICGEHASHPLELAATLRSALSLSGHTDASSDIVLTAMETAPATLLTDVTVLLLCLSPCHPWTAARVVERWVPLFSHLNALRILVVATRCELLLSPTARHALRLHGTDAVEMDDVLGVVSDLEVTTAASEVAFTAVSLPVPLHDVVGATESFGAANHRNNSSFSPSVWNLCRLLVKCARCATLSATAAPENGDPPLRWLPTTESSAGAWQQLVDQLHVEAELRSLLPEWIEVHLADHVAAPTNSTAAVGVLHDTDRVYVSRRTQEVVDVRPAQLVLNDMNQFQASFASQQRILEQNRAELYLNRKAIAEADRKRAVDRSARRSAVADPVLLKREKRSALQQQVALLERRHERLLARNAENAATRALLEEVRAQVQQAQELTRGDPEDAAHHAAVLAEWHAKLGQLDAESHQAAQCAKDLEDAGLPAEGKRATAAYLAAWGTSKQLRIERDAVQQKLADAEALVTQHQERLAAVNLHFDDLCHRCAAHVEEANRLQDESLRLQSLLIRLEPVSRRRRQGPDEVCVAPPIGTAKQGGGTGSNNPASSQQHRGYSLTSDEWLGLYLLPSEAPCVPGGDVAGALERLADAKGRFVDHVLVPWSLCCDCESGALMIEALADAARLARRATLPSLQAVVTKNSDTQALVDFERAARSSIVAEELHVRLSRLLLEAHIVGLLETSDRMLRSIVEKVKTVAHS